jgi:hypothetical protein
MIARALAIIVFFAVVLSWSTSGGQFAPKGVILKTWPDDRQEFRITEARQIDYATLVSSPELFIGEEIAFRGKVVQVFDAEGGTSMLRINVTPDKDFRYYTDTVIVSWPSARPSVSEGDVADFIGVFMGMRGFDRMIGGGVTYPFLTSSRAPLGWHIATRVVPPPRIAQL